MSRFRLHSIPFLMLLILVLLDRFIDISLVFYPLCGVLFVSMVYCIVLYVGDRKEIRLLLPAPFFWLEYVLVVVTILLLAIWLYLDFFNKDLFPSHKGLSGFGFVVFLVCMIPYLVGQAFMERYLNSNKLLESGVRVGRVVQKKYAWNQIKGFEFNEQKNVIRLFLQNGKVVQVKSQYPEFDYKISEIELFLR